MSCMSPQWQDLRRAMQAVNTLCTKLLVLVSMCAFAGGSTAAESSSPLLPGEKAGAGKVCERGAAPCCTAFSASEFRAGVPIYLAAKRLTQLGWRIDDSRCPDCFRFAFVLARPPELLNPGICEVSLSRQAVVPLVKGMTRSRAEKALADYGLAPRPRDCKNASAVVQGQDKQAGTWLAAFSELGFQCDATSKAPPLPIRVAVPPVTGLLAEDAERIIAWAQLKALRHRSCVGAGLTVARQSPEWSLSQTRDKNSPMTIWCEPHAPKVPNLLGMTATRAHDVAVASGFFVGNKVVASAKSDCAAVVVIAQRPAAYEGSPPGPIDVTMSDADNCPPPPSVEARTPDLIGMTVERATSEVAKARGMEGDLVTQERPHSDCFAVVLDQMPQRGSALSNSAAIQVTVGRSDGCEQAPASVLPTEDAGSTTAGIAIGAAGGGLLLELLRRMLKLEVKVRNSDCGQTKTAIKRRRLTVTRQRNGALRQD
jgi:beta-lactam-binding protein with PASTA domain